MHIELSERPDSDLRAYAADTTPNMQTGDHSYNNSMNQLVSDSYNFMTGVGVLEVPLKDQATQLLQGPPISEEGGAGAQNRSGTLMGTLYTNQQLPASSGEYPSNSESVVPTSHWENMNGAKGLFNNHATMQNILNTGSAMMAAPSIVATAHPVVATAQLLIGGLVSDQGSINDSTHGDHGSVYYTSAPVNDVQQQEPNLAHTLYYVNTAAGYDSNGATYHSNGHVDPAGVTILYPTQDEGSGTHISCDRSQIPFRADAFQQLAMTASAGINPLSLQESSAGNQNYHWLNARNEHSFLPMNDESLNNHVNTQFSISQAYHDLSQRQQSADHMSNGVGLHMEGISVNGQGLSLSLSTHQSHFHSAGGQLPESDHMEMAAIDQAAAIAKTKELASRYLTEANADLSRFRTPDVMMEARILQEQWENAGRKHVRASSSQTGPSGAGSGNHLLGSPFLHSAQAILNEVCRVAALKRHPKPARSSDGQQHNYWNNMGSGGSLSTVEGNYAYNGREDSARSGSVMNEVDSVRDPVSVFNTHSSPQTIAVMHINPVESEMIQGLADAARTQNGDDLDCNKTKISFMHNEVDVRYRRYCDSLQLLITAFNSQAGPNSATPYTILALQAMSRHFRCLKDAIGNQLKIVRKALGEDPNAGLGESSRLRYVDQQIRQQRALQQLGVLQQHAWRPQRGLPERAVSVLRAWLFEHFLHPYPKDVDKLSLAKSTGLTRSQVSNWFINARVRLWKPMVEEMYVEEQKEPGDEQRVTTERPALRDQAEMENKVTYEQYDGERARNSGLLHEVSANAQAPRIQNVMKRNEDRSEQIENGPDSVLTEVGGTSVGSVHSHPVFATEQDMDIDEAGSYNQEGREPKKSRPNCVPDVFTPSASLMQPVMNCSGGNCAQENQNFEGGDAVQVKDDVTDFGTQSLEALNQNNQGRSSFAASQQGSATIDHIQPNVGGAGAFGVYDSHNIGHKSFGNQDPESRGYASRVASATTVSTGTVSLTLGLRHCEENQINRSSLLSPNIVNLPEPYNIGSNDEMNELNTGVDLYEGRIMSDMVSHNGQLASTPMTNGHYPQSGSRDDNNSTNSNSEGQERSAHHDESNSAN